METISRKQYDVTVQWTDLSQGKGYRETLLDAVVEASSAKQALAAGRKLRPNVSSVCVHGVHGTLIAFHGSTFSWYR